MRDESRPELRKCLHAIQVEKKREIERRAKTRMSESNDINGSSLLYFSIACIMHQRDPETHNLIWYRKNVEMIITYIDICRDTKI